MFKITIEMNLLIFLYSSGPDWFLLSFLLIVSGGIGCTFLLFLFTGNTDYTIRKHVNIMQLEILEIKERQQRNEEKLKQQSVRTHKMLDKIALQITSNEKKNDNNMNRIYILLDIINKKNT